MIIEGLVSTVNADGSPHLAPMGPRFETATPDRMLLRPFPTSHTYQNLLRHPAGVFHTTDDVLLLARASIGAITRMPELIPAATVVGNVLRDCCAWMEFRVDHVDDSQARVRMSATIVHRGRGRDWLGFNRAQHAVVEAAILATRVHLLPPEHLSAEFHTLKAIVYKTGGPVELEAFRLLEAHVHEAT